MDVNGTDRLVVFPTSGCGCVTSCRYSYMHLSSCGCLELTVYRLRFRARLVKLLWLTRATSASF